MKNRCDCNEGKKIYLAFAFSFDSSCVCLDEAEEIVLF